MKKYINFIGIAGIVLLAAALIWFSISRIWGAGHWILLVLGAAGLAYFLFDYVTGRQKEFSGRSLKQGSNMLVQVIAVLAIVAMLAFVTTRQHFRKDWTKNNLYSLSDQTEKVLSNLKKDVEIKGFFKSAEKASARDLLDEYDYRSAHLSYELIDPDENPDVTKQYGVKQYGTLIVESGAKRETVENLKEADLTNAIVKVTRNKDKVIYFLTGHGERSITDDSPQGYKDAVEQIRKENHLVRELNLVRSRRVPDSCSVLAIVRPTSPLFPAEWDSVKSYLKRGGKVLLMTDPDHPADVADFAQTYGLTIGNDMVIDASGMGQLFGAGPAMPLVTTYDEKQPIFKGFNIMTFYPYACSVTPGSGKNGYTLTSLMKTSRDSWAETDVANGKVTFNEGKDTPGPITIAAIAEKTSGERKSILAVFGDSDFAMNGYFKNQGNANLFLNTINYLAEEEDMISIRPKQIEDRRLTLTQADVSALFYLVVIAIPLLVIILGVIIYYKRNRS